MTATPIYRHFLRALDKWPNDPLRPYVSFEKMMRARLDAQFRTENPIWDEKEAARQLHALELLLRDELKKKYPLSPKILEPASNPRYYTRLIEELERSAQNRPVSWIRNFFRWR